MVHHHLSLPSISHVAGTGAGRERKSNGDYDLMKTGLRRRHGEVGGASSPYHHGCCKIIMEWVRNAQKCIFWKGVRGMDGLSSNLDEQ